MSDLTTNLRKVETRYNYIIKDIKRSNKTFTYEVVLAFVSLSENHQLSYMW